MLPPELLSPVPNVSFGIFDLAIPDIVAWIIIVVIFIAAAWIRLPKFLEPNS
jgi:hypothetical protein